MNKHLTQTLMASLAAAALLSGCGQSANVAGLASSNVAGFNAEAARTLKKAFFHIHQAAFTKLDANADKSIDEYEWGPGDLRDFNKADKNRNGKLTRTEFNNYADGTGFFRQDKDDFMKDTRNALGKAFSRLDANRDRMLQKEEMNSKALKKLGMYLALPGLNIKVVVDEFDGELFTASDRTGDKLLSQAEFEDYCMDEFIFRINPDYQQNPAPPAPPEPAPPAEEPATEG